MEQQPRAQRGVVVLEQGEALKTVASPLTRPKTLIFATRHRPVGSARGHYRVTVRHGVSRLLSGERDLSRRGVRPRR